MSETVSVDELMAASLDFTRRREIVSAVLADSGLPFTQHALDYPHGPGTWERDELASRIVSAL